MATKAPTATTPPIAPRPTPQSPVTPPTQAPPVTPQSTVPLDLTPELKSMEQGYTKQPDEYILTVKVKRFFLSVKGADIIILKDGKELDRAATDSNGEIAFNLKPGDYTVQYGEKKVPINIKAHSTLKF